VRIFKGKFDRPISCGNAASAWDEVAKKKKAELRLYIDPNVDRLIRAIATLRDETISSLTEQALREWLSKPENEEFIKYHRLDEPMR
jgi:hypothetical protein